MPKDYRCNSCGLICTLGWFPYDIEGDYCAETDLVCTACGTGHRVQHPWPGKLADLLWAQPGPVFATEVGSDHDYHEEGWRPCGVSVEVLPAVRTDDCQSREDEADVLKLGEVQCAHCHAKGALTQTWPSDETRCPHCDKRTLELFTEWIT